MTLQFTRRASDGIQFDFAYTLGKSEDNAPITGIALGAGRRRPVRTPKTSNRDRGPNVLDQRHTFVGSIVATPRYDGDNAVLRGLVNGTVLGVGDAVAPAAFRSTSAATGEINNDGIGSDRPAGVPRNSLNLPARKNVDLRLSRQLPHRRRTKAEVIAEVKNVFNTVQWSRRHERQRRRERGDRRAGQSAADQRRSADAERRLRAASVPAGLQVHLLASNSVGSEPVSLNVAEDRHCALSQLIPDVLASVAPNTMPIRRPR